jgi:hypothetical protein
MADKRKKFKENLIEKWPYWRRCIIKRFGIKNEMGQIFGGENSCLYHPYGKGLETITSQTDISNILDLEDKTLVKFMIEIARVGKKSEQIVHLEHLECLLRNQWEPIECTDTVCPVNVYGEKYNPYDSDSDTDSPCMMYESPDGGWVRTSKCGRKYRWKVDFNDIPENFTLDTTELYYMPGHPIWY